VSKIEEIKAILGYYGEQDSQTIAEEIDRLYEPKPAEGRLQADTELREQIWFIVQEVRLGNLSEAEATRQIEVIIREGYYKVREGKPPLLTGDELVALWDRWNRESYFFFSRKITDAQRDADMRFYNG